MSAAPYPESISAPDWNAICQAHERIAPRIHRTPVMTSQSLDAIAGARIFFKCENLQKTGSFKIRGATNTIFSLDAGEAARGVVTHSSGNHAAAVAYAARLRGTRAWIVMPSNAPSVKMQAVKAYGGQITLCEPLISARAETCARIERETGAVMVHPYDDDRIIAGQATAAKELFEDISDLDAVLAPVSGGGLLSGTALGARGIRAAIRVIGCEPQRADDAHRSLATGQLQPLDKSDTIADGLRAPLAPRTFAILRQHVDGIVLVTEEEIIDSMRAVWERMKIVIEPSSAVAVAPLLGVNGVASLALPPRADGQPNKIGVILSGGNVDLASLPFSRSPNVKEVTEPQLRM